MKFVVISGVDACGKDTQIARLRDYFQSQGHKTQRLSALSSLEDFSGLIDSATLEAQLNVFLLKFEPIARTLFLQSLIANALDKIERDTEVVIFSGYWYKFAASEAAYGVPFSFWSNSAAQYFPKPDVAIHLDVSYETCIKRRKKWTPYEKGLARYWGVPKLEFEQFQRSNHQHFYSLFSVMSDPVYRIDGNYDEEQVWRNVLSIFDDSPMPKSTELFLDPI
jgi:thymidylate kinase